MCKSLVGLALFLATAVSAAPLRWSKIEGSPAFAGWKAELRQVVQEEGSIRVNHFCVVVQSRQPERGPYDAKAPPPESIALVYWLEGHKVLEWAARGDDGRMLPVPGSGSLDVHGDIVSTKADLHGSTYQETRGWLASLKRHCASAGTQVMISRETR